MNLIPESSEYISRNQTTNQLMSSSLVWPKTKTGALYQVWINYEDTIAMVSITMIWMMNKRHLNISVKISNKSQMKGLLDLNKGFYKNISLQSVQCPVLIFICHVFQLLFSKWLYCSSHSPVHVTVRLSSSTYKNTFYSVEFGNNKPIHSLKSNKFPMHTKSSEFSIQWICLISWVFFLFFQLSKKKKKRLIGNASVIAQYVKILVTKCDFDP